MKYAAALLALFTVVGAKPQDKKALRVLVWDEQQEEQKTVYENFLGNHLAAYLKKDSTLEIKSANINDLDQGLSNADLDNADVLVWWGHVRHADVHDHAVEHIVERIVAGKLALVAIHSAHYSKPFKAIMYERQKQDILAKLPAGTDKSKVVFEMSGWGEPKEDAREERDGKLVITVTAPDCGLGGVDGHGLPSHVTTVAPDHPIAKGIPAKFDIKQTEMYNELFTVPAPDTVVFHEKWDAGEEFRAGCAWDVGKGRVFYFRPGHETFPVFHQEETQKIIHNAVLWAGRRS